MSDIFDEILLGIFNDKFMNKFPFLLNLGWMKFSVAVETIAVS